MSRYFKGGQGLIVATDVSALKITAELTVFCWAKLNKDDASFHQDTLLAKWGTGSNRSWLLDLQRTGTVSFNILDSNGSGVGWGAAAPIASSPYGRWIPCGGVASQAGSFTKAWADGKMTKAAGSTFATANSTLTVKVGQRDDSGSVQCYMNGWVAHVAIWAASLTESEMRALAGGASPLMIRRGALRAYWPLEEPNGLVDLSGGVTGLTLASGSPGSGAIPASPETPTFPSQLRPFRRFAAVTSQTINGSSTVSLTDTVTTAGKATIHGVSTVAETVMVSTAAGATRIPGASLTTELVSILSVGTARIHDSLSVAEVVTITTVPSRATMVMPPASEDSFVLDPAATDSFVLTPISDA